MSRRGRPSPTSLLVSGVIDERRGSEESGGEQVVSTTSPAQEPADGDDAVHLSSTVRVRDADGEEEYTIVRSAEALVVRGRISMESPVGRALLGRRRGDRIEVRTPVASAC
jgi:transcription elongation GreA/GreB family factor